MNKMNGLSRPENLDLDLLRTFVRIAEMGSFTRAGEMVGRTQSAVSMQMRRLETMTGKPLLLRGKGGVVRLTADGQHILSYAQEILELNDSILAAFRGQTPRPRIVLDQDPLPAKAQREAFTAQIMVTLLTNDKFCEANALIMRHVENKTVVEPQNINERDDDLIMSLLSMLEYISINFLSNAMDRTIILRQRQSGLLRTYEVLQNYIAHKREAWGRPNAYRSFEEVIKSHILTGSALQNFATNATDPIPDFPARMAAMDMRAP
ncbi:LysR family transcriptional regulator [Acidisoma cellulosilytica]|uniref:LysR family transcriptional regulator n=1 Tax=Acidisoma cellulosilyticum TaxID=2802395 RepID=A0A964E2N7_9PROT|nr:LysR family transcriptional regulator [Acidisoma cellulosilyticum]MCB8879601.1 LysR family transcriptional regulator [Acidisoma cellulosilyticum]